MSMPQIAESFRRFGIADATTNLLVIKLSISPDITHGSVKQHLDAVVEGDAVAFDDQVLARMTDLARIRKIYKLNVPVQTSGKKKREGDNVSDESERKELEVMVLGLMALRGAN